MNCVRLTSRTGSPGALAASATSSGSGARPGSLAITAAIPPVFADHAMLFRASRNCCFRQTMRKWHTMPLGCVVLVQSASLRSTASRARNTAKATPRRPIEDPNVPPLLRGFAQLRVQRANRGRVRRSEAGSIPCLSRCARSPRRSLSLSSTSRQSSARRGPTPESESLGPPSGPGAHRPRRRSAVAGCRRPRQRRESVRYARRGSRSERSGVGRPSDSRRRLRRRRPDRRRSGSGPVSARSRTSLPGARFGGLSGRGRTSDAAGCAPRAPRRPDR
jgi:hypothetical protein